MAVGVHHRSLVCPCLAPPSLSGYVLVCRCLPVSLSLSLRMVFNRWVGASLPPVGAVAYRVVLCCM